MITLEATSDVRPILFARANADADYRADVGHTKRFFERLWADDAFREMLRTDAQGARTKWGLVRDPDEVRTLWDKRAHAAWDPDVPLPLSVRRYLAYQKEKVGARDRYRRLGAPLDPRFATWRSRQMARCVSHLGGCKAEYVVHAPVCFELTKGCSVGCWFCSVSAPRLSEQWLYTPANARLWRETLEVFRDLIGPPAGMGFCYWASDPLDNPDYENYLLDFKALLGEFPQTTTAQAQKHVERVRQLLRTSEAQGGTLDRFSIITLKQWNEVHAAFDAAELTFVECIPQNKEAINADSKTIAGRALEAHRKLAARGKEAPRDEDATFTTACVSGFLVNMIDRTVRLITPCHASTRWPLGYWVVDHGRFNDAADLRALLERMVVDHMPVGVGRDETARFRGDLVFETTEDGFVLSTRYARHASPADPRRRKLGVLVHAGTHTAADIALTLLDEDGVPLEESFLWLNDLRERGLLDEEPAGAQNTLGEWIPAPL